MLSIFPEYLSGPLQVSLLGKAVSSGLLDVHLHDLRTWTSDRHRTVDDTPYGGGAGMVMRPEPWGLALDEIVPAGGARLVVPTPSGRPFTQALAHELAGGEAAVLVVVEAVARLLPGFLGNPESLTEESHAGGLLEYPVYTRPPVWRELPVPEVLTSGDHGAVARWRRDQSLRRTAARRPDLLAAADLSERDRAALD